MELGAQPFPDGFLEPGEELFFLLVPFRGAFGARDDGTATDPFGFKELAESAFRPCQGFLSEIRELTSQTVEKRFPFCPGLPTEELLDARQNPLISFKGREALDEKFCADAEGLFFCVL